MDSYEAHKDRERQRQAELSRSSRDIGKPPKCVDKRRRARAEKSLRACCEIYFSKRFPLAWSEDHLEQLAEIERVVLEGGLQAIAAPRGDGKTTRLEVGIFWGVVVVAAHQYAVLLTATGAHAPKRISSLKTELLTNDLLLQDFPEVCFPIRAMAGIANRCNGQLCEGLNTWPGGAESPWSRKRIVLPTVAGSACSGAVVESAGLLEATRGLNYTRSDGSISRPSVGLIDDPQTTRSAKSTRQSEERENALASGIIHLAGPDQSFSALASLTVIRRGDMAAKILDRQTHPEWHGILKKLLYSWPDDWTMDRKTGEVGHWDKYAELYRESLAQGGDGTPATNYYKRHRKPMDAGAVIAWKERHPGCVSAIEFAMRLFFRDRQSFFSEFQNDPEEAAVESQLETLTSDAIAAKVSGYERGEIPGTCNRITWFADCHKQILYWVVMGWADGFTGYVIDYGTWPDQESFYFDEKHLRRQIGKTSEITATTDEGRLQQSLDCLFAQLAGREWIREDGVELRPDLGMVDANWMSDPVYAACREAGKKHGLRILPSHGVPFGPAKCPISRYDRKTNKGSVLGDEWQIPPGRKCRAIRHVIQDAGRRKSFVHRRLATPTGDPGSITLFHAPAHRHRLFAEHLTAETAVEVFGPYGKVAVWSQIPGRPNHWLDCIVGATTAESICGGRLLAAPANGTTAAGEVANGSKANGPKASGSKASGGRKPADSQGGPQKSAPTKIGGKSKRTAAARKAAQQASGQQTNGGQASSARKPPDSSRKKQRGRVTYF